MDIFDLDIPIVKWEKGEFVPNEQAKILFKNVTLDSMGLKKSMLKKGVKTHKDIREGYRVKIWGQTDDSGVIIFEQNSKVLYDLAQNIGLGYVKDKKVIFSNDKFDSLWTHKRLILSSSNKSFISPSDSIGSSNIYIERHDNGIILVEMPVQKSRLIEQCDIRTRLASLHNLIQSNTGAAITACKEIIQDIDDQTELTKIQTGTGTHREKCFNLRNVLNSHEYDMDSNVYIALIGDYKKLRYILDSLFISKIHVRTIEEGPTSITLGFSGEKRVIKEPKTSICRYHIDNMEGKFEDELILTFAKDPDIESIVFQYNLSEMRVYTNNKLTSEFLTLLGVHVLTKRARRDADVILTENHPKTLIETINMLIEQPRRARVHVYLIGERGNVDVYLTQLNCVIHRKLDPRCMLTIVNDGSKKMPINKKGKVVVINNGYNRKALFLDGFDAILDLPITKNMIRSIIQAL